MFLDLGEVALSRGCPMCPSSSVPSCHSRARDQLVPVFADSNSTGCQIAVSWLLLSAPWWGKLV